MSLSDLFYEAVTEIDTYLLDDSLTGTPFFPNVPEQRVVRPPTVFASIIEVRDRMEHLRCWLDRDSEDNLPAFRPYPAVNGGPE